MPHPKNIYVDEMKRLREQGCSYKEITGTLPVTKDMCSYYLSSGRKAAQIRYSEKHRKNNPLSRKIETFHYRRPRKENNGYQPPKGPPRGSFSKRVYWFKNRWRRKQPPAPPKNMPRNFNSKDLLKKIGGWDNARCALTGKKIDLNDVASYHLDHIMPKAKGGLDELENCQILCAYANKAKSDMTSKEFLALCKDVLKNAGYKLAPPKK
jgi:5-methylcytosine-specific restriction endonuclease McrA